MTPETLQTEITRSRFLRCGRTRTGRTYAYHTLFGNFSWLDEDLYEYLNSNQSPDKIPILDLQSRTNDEVVKGLLDSYFYTFDPDEERLLLKEVLREREQKVSSGYYLSGLQVSSSNACNFSCSYCFADTSDSRSAVRSRVAEGKSNISFELAEAAISRVRDVGHRHGRQAIAVKFLGREPLINWRVIEQLLERFSDGSVQWAITTNGSLITREIAQVLKQHKVLVMVSLDGTAEVNDQNRLLKYSDEGTFALIEQGIKNLAEVGHSFGISSVVSSAMSSESMFSFVDQIAQYGARELELTLVMQTTKLVQLDCSLGAKKARMGADIQRLASSLIEIYQRATRHGILVHGDWVDPFHRLLTTHKFRNESEVQRPLGAGCTATSHQISLEPTGDLFPCRAMSLHYGNIANLEAIMAAEEYQRVMMRTFYNVAYCRDCTVEGFCQGTCLGSSEQASGDIYNPQEEYCAVYREATTQLLNTLEN